jgi:hypothetical protein
MSDDQPKPQAIPIAAQGKPVSERLCGATANELIVASLQLFAEAKSHVAIYTRDLDPAILNTSGVLVDLRALALRPANPNSGPQIRILLQNTQRAVRDGHRLIELSRRLPDAFSFRCPQAEDLRYLGAFSFNDRYAFIERHFGDRFDYIGNRYDVAGHGRLKRYFDEVWERAQPASELRRLSL